MIFEVALSVYDAVICLLNAVNSPYIASTRKKVHMEKG